MSKSNDNAPYELLYWPSIPGRGEFIRLLFEEAGVPFTDHSLDETAVDQVLKLSSEDNIGDENNPAIFATPALRHGSLLINQTPNILLYLAPRLKLAPPAGDDAFYHLNAIVQTILDGLSDETHDTHHPIAPSLYYEDQKVEAKRRAKAYRDLRLPKFFAYLQRVLNAKSSGDGPWLYGGSLTYADLILFQCIDGLFFAFPKTMAKLKESGKYDGIFKLYEAVKERPNIKAYISSDRRKPFSHGMYRYYPELEED